MAVCCHETWNLKPETIALETIALAGAAQAATIPVRFLVYWSKFDGST
jgi:hypothetical protein